MAATRTQIYLTEEQRRGIDEVTKAEGVTMAEVIRRAIDAYLARTRVDPQAAFAATFGQAPSMRYPDREEWERG